MIPRRKPLLKSGKPKAVNRKRKAKNFARAYHSKARVEFVKSLPCTYCWGLSPFFAMAPGTSHNAHTVGGGTSRKADYTTIIPLCASHHTRYDEHQPPFDKAKIRSAMVRAATVVERMWQAHLEKKPTHQSVTADAR